MQIRETPRFSKWLEQLSDLQAKDRVHARIQRLSLGLVGDVRGIGDGISELRIHYGPGYRVYFPRVGPAIVLLLIGGDKRTQQRDIARAIDMAKSL